MPLTKEQADAASEALLREPRRVQEELTVQAAARVNYRAPWQWAVPAALAGAATTGAVAYLGSGSFHPWWMIGVGLGVATAQTAWRKRRKV